MGKLNLREVTAETRKDALFYKDRAERFEERIAQLEAAIQTHRDQKADDRCWMDDQALYAVLGDDNLGDNRVGDPAAMLENCKRFIERRCAGGEWPTYAELEARIAQLEKQLRTGLAAQAVTAVLDRIRTDGRLAYLIGPFSNSYERLTDAYAEMTSQDPEKFREIFEASLKPEPWKRPAD